MIIHMESTFAEQIKFISKQLNEIRESIHGITYKLMDVREVLQNIGDDEIAILHPSSSKTSKAAQTKIDEIIKFPHKFEEFDYKKESERLFMDCRERRVNSIWSFYGISDIDSKFHIGGEKRKTTLDNSKVDIYASTQIELLDDFKEKNGMVAQRDKFFEKVQNFQIVPEDYEITQTTKIEAVTTNRETALYLRDIWAHKMGVTAASSYYIITLDGMAFGVTGLEMRTVYTMKDKTVSEVFGFDQPLTKHPKSHRLFMMLLTCQGMIKTIRNNAKKNRLWEIKNFKTICLTKYRKLKSSTGILEVTFREKLPNGNYRLIYETPIWKRSFEETLEFWLTEDGGAYGS